MALGARAFRLRRLARSLRRHVVTLWVCDTLIKSRVMWSCEDPGKFLSKRSLLDPGKVLNRRSCENPGEILSKRPVHEKLADAMS